MSSSKEAEQLPAWLVEAPHAPMTGFSSITHLAGRCTDGLHCTEVTGTEGESPEQGHTTSKRLAWGLNTGQAVWLPGLCPLPSFYLRGKSSG